MDCFGVGKFVPTEIPTGISEDAFKGIIKGIIVGERPGQSEVEEGKPFVGPSGKLLFSSLNRNEWIITNIIKCELGSQEQCKRKFIQELEVLLNMFAINFIPTLLLLGKVAVESFPFPEKLSYIQFSVEQSGGYFYTKLFGKEVLIVLAVHPAYVLRNKANALLTRALKVAHKKQIFPMETIITKVSEQDLLRILSSSNADKVAVDVEYLNGKPVCVGIAVDELHGYSGQLTPAVAKVLLQKQLIGHNLAYDIPILETVAKVNFLPENIYADTSVFYHWLWSDFKKGLDHLAPLVGVVPYKQSFLKRVGGWNGLSGMSKSLFGIPEELYTYNAKDALVSYRLAKLLIPSINVNKKFRRFWQIFKYFIMSVIEMETMGVWVNRQILLRERIKLQESRARILAELNKLGFKFNPLSSKDVLQYFTSKGHKIQSSKESILIEIATQYKDPVANKILEYRKVSKLLSTYVEKFLELSKTAERVKSHFNITGTPAHRLSSSEPNLQALPVEWYGSVISAPPGKKLIGIDYSQIELRVLALMSGDSVMIDEFKSGVDIHTATAREVLGCKGELTVEDRRRAKGINFGMVYGLSAPALARTLGCDEVTAQRIINRFFQKYKRVKEWREEVYEQAKNKGYVESLFGRRRRVLLAEEAGKNLFNISINSTIQASAMDIVTVDMATIYKERGKTLPSKDKLTFVLQVHDAVYFEALPDIDGTIIKQFIEETWDLEVPIVVSVKEFLTPT